MHGPQDLLIWVEMELRGYARLYELISSTPNILEREEAKVNSRTSGLN